MTALTWIVASLYAFAGLVAVVAARRVRLRSVAEMSLPFVSVVVAARDEEQALPACLAALRSQRYPADRIEFIVADDGSTDGTAAVVSNVAREDPRVRLVRVPLPTGTLRGKANALHHAIAASRGRILLVTDADCAPPPDWARTLAGAMEADERLGLLAGVTLPVARGWLGAAQRLDLLLGFAVAAGSSALGLPLTAMGNNMAIRRAAYDAVGGYPALPFSVTEDFLLLQHIESASPFVARVVLDNASLNRTEPVPTLGAVLRQRRRWARGGVGGSPSRLAFLGLLFLSHLFTFLAALDGNLAPLGFKLAADALVLSLAARHLHLRLPWSAFGLFEFVLYLYVLLTPLLLLQPGLTWKGRQL